jgi:hypothetical protein
MLELFSIVCLLIFSWMHIKLRSINLITFLCVKENFHWAKIWKNCLLWKTENANKKEIIYEFQFFLSLLSYIRKIFAILPCWKFIKIWRRGEINFSLTISSACYKQKQKRKRSMKRCILSEIWIFFFISHKLTIIQKEQQNSSMKI